MSLLKFLIGTSTERLQGLWLFFLHGARLLI